MEYLDGEPLTERLARGPLPVADVLRHGIEIADALDKAHRTGIIHRDLKPGNVILTRSGAKLLDFGLAKAMDAALVESTSPHSITAMLPNEPLTAEGTLVGTFCYMAPEQVEYGRSDARTDIFAFGCMLYEMLTGRRAFNAASRAGMIAQIIASDPPPISTLRPMTPVSLDRVVRTCLAKNPDDRFQTAHDVMLALQWIRDEQTNPSAPLPMARARGRMWRERAAWALALVVAIGAAVGIAMWSRREIDSLDRPMTASIVPPRGLRFVFTGDYAGSPVLSHDGRRVAFVAVSPEGKRTLWVRSLDSADPREIDNSDDAMFPFWSPDNRSLGFFAHGKLKTVDAARRRSDRHRRRAERARRNVERRQRHRLHARNARRPLSRRRQRRHAGRADHARRRHDHASLAAVSPRRQVVSLPRRESLRSRLARHRAAHPLARRPQRPRRHADAGECRVRRRQAADAARQHARRAAVRRQRAAC